MAGGGLGWPPVKPGARSVQGGSQRGPTPAGVEEKGRERMRSPGGTSRFEGPEEKSNREEGLFLGVQTLALSSTPLRSERLQ